MPIKVLAVGPNDIKDLIYDVGKEYPEIIINYVTYNSENEVVKIVKKHEQHIDILPLDVPVSRIIPTRSSVRDGLQRVLLEGKSLRYLDSQIAIGIINLSHMYEGEHLSEYQLQRRILALQNILVDYGEKSQSIIKWPDRKEVRFITTRGALQFKNGNSKELKLLKELFNKTQIKASLGIGIGRTANEAEIHAKEALGKASINKPSCFLVDNDGAVHGPIGNEVQLSYSIRVDNQKVLNIAKRANMSGSVINRLLSFCEIHGKMTFTAAELADGFGITPRSARRILIRLEQVGLAAVTGEEQPINRGRPRQIYSILLNKKI